MDIVTGILFGGIALGLICWGLIYWINYLNQKDDQATINEFHKLLTGDSNDDWDGEYIRAEAEKHHITKIEPTKYWYKKNRDKTYDGMRWYCTCGGTDIAMSLNMAEVSFNRHKKLKREETLAQLGRFK